MFGQVFYNNLYSYNNSNSTPEFNRSIIVLPNGNIINLSNGTESQSNYTSNIIRLIDSSGSLIWEDYLTADTLSLFGQWNHVLQVINDSTFIIFGTAQKNTDEYNFPYFLKYDYKNQQLKDLFYFSDSNTNYVGRILSAIYHSDGYVYGVGWEHKLNFEPEMDMLLMKINTSGNLIWKKTIDKGYVEFLYDIESFNENSLVISGGNNSNIDETLEYIAIIDTAGNIVDDYFGLETISTYACATHEEFIYYTAKTDESYTWSENHQHLIKFDNQLNIVWDTLLQKTGQYKITLEELEVIDDQILMAGSILNHSEYTGISNVWLWGYACSWSLDGQFNWEHVYFYDSLNIHYIKDIEQDINGNLVFMGTVIPSQLNHNLWLFNTDINGCGILQDTCYNTIEQYFDIDTLVSLEQWDKNSNIITINGNPFKESLNFTIENINTNNMHFELMDFNGRIVEFGKINLYNQIETFNLMPGIYILNIYNYNKIEFSNKPVKSY